MRASPFRTGLLLAAGILIADQATKFWILGLLAQHPFGIEVTSFFNLTMVWNRGVSFGLFNSPDAASYQRWGLTALAFGAAGGLFIWLWREPRLILAMGVGMIAGGAVGNAIDRILYGAVADFFDFHLGGWHWPAFNIADAAIVLGVAVLLYDSLRDGAKTP